jgi:hypothetical protein
MQTAGVGTMTGSVAVRWVRQGVSAAMVGGCPKSLENMRKRGATGPQVIVLRP